MKPSTKALLVIALSSRPYVAAAKQAGFRVIAIDAFADRQTQNLAERVLVVDYDELGFRPEMMKEVINGLDLKDICGVIYGSGFEAQPALLQYIADRISLIGNAPDKVAAVKTPDVFFAALAKLAIPHPPLKDRHSTDRIANPSQKSYIRKLIGGSGGVHIQYVDGHPPLPGDYVQQYYDQQYIEGDSVSLLFLACEGQVEVLGFNEQWLYPSPASPFRYGGAVSNINLAAAIKMQLTQAAQRLTKEFGLQGLNSLDAVVCGGVAYILEINPRLSATLDLYPEKDAYLVRHIQACKPEGMTECALPSVSDVHQAHAIVYATETLVINAEFAWPVWATDIPFRELMVKPHQPLCSVLATGESSEAAKQLAQSRVKMLLKSLTENNKVQSI